MLEDCFFLTPFDCIVVVLMEEEFVNAVVKFPSSERVVVVFFVASSCSSGGWGLEIKKEKAYRPDDLGTDTVGDRRCREFEK